MRFLRAMIDQIEGGLCIDKSRIFSTGWSYGGMMSLAVGREFGGIIRAVEPMLVSVRRPPQGLRALVPRRADSSSTASTHLSWTL
jgi:poly(3-hydroxybutyrate) depolymerase